MNEVAPSVVAEEAPPFEVVKGQFEKMGRVSDEAVDRLRGWIAEGGKSLKEKAGEIRERWKQGLDVFLRNPVNDNLEKPLREAKETIGQNIERALTRIYELQIENQEHQRYLVDFLEFRRRIAEGADINLEEVDRFHRRIPWPLWAGMKLEPSEKGREPLAGPFEGCDFRDVLFSQVRLRAAGFRKSLLHCIDECEIDGTNIRGRQAQTLEGNVFVGDEGRIGIRRSQFRNTDIRNNASFRCSSLWSLQENHWLGHPGEVADNTSISIAHNSGINIRRNKGGGIGFNKAGVIVGNDATHIDRNRGLGKRGGVHILCNKGTGSIAFNRAQHIIDNETAFIVGNTGRIEENRHPNTGEPSEIRENGRILGRWYQWLYDIRHRTQD